MELLEPQSIFLPDMSHIWDDDLLLQQSSVASSNSSLSDCSGLFGNSDSPVSFNEDYSTFSMLDSKAGVAPQSTTPTAFLVFKVQFKSTTDDFFLADSCTRDIAIGDCVKVEADRGHDVGVVSDVYWPSADELASLMSTNRKFILSIASPQEEQLSKTKARDEARAFAICQDVVANRNMQISLVDAEYQYDRKKLTFFFTSNGHTDFRELVRDLFSIFKTRIWMQKIKPFEALAFQNDRCPIPRSNGGSSSPPSTRRNQPQMHMKNTYISGDEHQHMSRQYPSYAFGSEAAKHMAHDIYRTQLNLQLNKPVAPSTHGLLGQPQECLPDRRSRMNVSNDNYHRRFPGNGRSMPQHQEHIRPLQNPLDQYLRVGENDGYTSFSSYAARHASAAPLNQIHSHHQRGHIYDVPAHFY